MDDQIYKHLSQTFFDFCNIQGTLVPKLKLGSFLTLSVRNGHKLKTGFLGSRPISRVKAIIKPTFY